jgi:hypothetical protein
MSYHEINTNTKKFQAPKTKYQTNHNDPNSKFQTNENSKVLPKNIVTDGSGMVRKFLLWFMFWSLNIEIWDFKIFQILPLQ